MSWMIRALIVLLLLLITCCVALAAGEAGTWVLDDFEDGDLVGTPGLSWFALADDVGGGASEARLDPISGGAAGSKHAMKLAGRLASPDGHAFAGAWISLDGSGRNVDLRSFDGFRMRVRGSGRLQAGLRAGGTNFMADVEAGPEWKLVEIPFASLAPLGKVPEGTKLSVESAQAFGVTTPQMPGGKDRLPGEIDVEIDEVAFYGHGAGRPAPIASGPPGGSSLVPFTPLASIPESGWVVLAEDPARDGNHPALPDATRLEAIPSSKDGFLWVRISLREPPNDRWMGMNLALDLDGDPSDGFPWWGANKGFKLDQLVSVWCFRVAGGCQGYIGLSGVEDLKANSYAARAGARLRFAIDEKTPAYVVGVPRDLLQVKNGSFRLVAAVGSALLFADDVPGQGAALLH